MAYQRLWLDDSRDCIRDALFIPGLRHVDGTLLSNSGPKTLLDDLSPLSDRNSRRAR